MKMKKYKILFTVLIVFVMVVGILPMMTFATTTQESYIILDKREGLSEGQRLDSATPYLVNGAPSATGTLGVDGCTVYFDESTRTLHLKDSVNEITSIHFWAEGSGIGKLKYHFTINVIGENVIKTEDYLEKVDAAGNLASIKIIDNITNGDITITSQSGGSLDILSKGIVRSYYSIITGDYHTNPTGSVNFTGNVSVNIESELFETETTEVHHGDIYAVYAQEGINILDDSSLSIKLRNSKTGSYRNNQGLFIAPGAEIEPNIVFDTTGNVTIDCTDVINKGNYPYENQRRPGKTILVNVGMLLTSETRDGRYSIKPMVYDETKYNVMNYYIQTPYGYDNYCLYTDIANSQLAMTNDVTVSGRKWTFVEPTDITVTVVGDTFVQGLSGECDWIKNLPENMHQSVTIVDENTAKITVSGTPVAHSNSYMEIMIPAEALTTREMDLAVSQGIARFDIVNTGDKTVVINRSDGGITVNGDGYTKTRLQNFTAITLDNFTASRLAIYAEGAGVRISLKGDNYIKTTNPTTKYPEAIDINNAAWVEFKTHTDDPNAILRIDMEGTYCYGIDTALPYGETATGETTFSSGKYIININGKEAEGKNEILYGIDTGNSMPIVVGQDADIDINIKTAGVARNANGFFTQKANISGGVKVNITGSAQESAGFVIHDNSTTGAMVLNGTKPVEIRVSRYTSDNSAIVYRDSSGYKSPIDNIEYKKNISNTWDFQSKLFDPVSSATASTQNLPKYSQTSKMTVVKNYVYPDKGSYQYFRYNYFPTPCETHTDENNDMDCDVCGRRIVIKTQPSQTAPASHTNGATATVAWGLQSVYTPSGFMSPSQAVVSYKLLKLDGTFTDWLTPQQLSEQTNGALSSDGYNISSIKFHHHVNTGRNYYLKLKVNEKFLNGESLEYESDMFSVVFGRKLPFTASGITLPFEDEPYSFNTSLITCGSDYGIAEIRYYDKASSQYITSGTNANRAHNIRAELVPLPMSSDISFDWLSVEVNGKPSSFSQDGSVPIELGYPKYMKAYAEDAHIFGAVGIAINPVSFKVRIDSPGVSFKDLGEGQNVRPWTSGLPAGLFIESERVYSGATEVTLTVRGVPTKEANNPLEIKIPQGGYLNGANETLVVKENPNLRVEIITLNTGKLYVCGTEVTDQNRNDIFGDGKARYDVFTGTLYLRNVNINHTASASEMSNIAAIYCDRALNVELSGENSITVSHSQDNVTCFAICADGKLTLSGNGKLTVRGGSATGKAKGLRGSEISVEGNVNLDVSTNELAIDARINGNVVLDSNGCIKLHSAKNITVSGYPIVKRGDVKISSLYNISEKVVDISQYVPGRIYAGDNESTAVQWDNSTPLKSYNYVHFAPQFPSYLIIDGSQITAVNATESGVVLLVASYDDSGKLIDVKMSSVSGGQTATKTISELGLDTEGATRIKAMLWSDFVKRKPLAPVAERDL